MAELPLNTGIPRFKANEDRFDKFVNGTEAQTWLTSDEQVVPTIRKFIADNQIDLDFVSEALDGKFDKSGGSIGGDTRVVDGLLSVNVADSVSSPRGIVWEHNGSPRFEQRLFGLTESGTVGGSDLVVVSYDNAGAVRALLEVLDRDTGSREFKVRPTLNGVGLATLAEVGSGSGVAGVASYNGRTGTVSPQSGDYNSTQVTHGTETVSEALVRAEVKTPWLTPEMFGAVGNGSTDDLAAFNAMLDAIGSRGGEILLPPKRYALSGNLVIKKNSVSARASKSRDNNFGTELVFAANKGLKFDGADGCEWHGGRILSAGGSTITDNGAALLALGALGLGGTGGGCAGNTFHDLDIVGGRRALHLGKTLSTRFYSSRFLGDDETGGQVVLMCNGADDDWGVDNAEFYSCNFAGKDGGSHDVIFMNGKAHGVKLFGCVVGWGVNGIVTDRSNGAWSHPKFLSIIGGGFENGDGNAGRFIYGDDFRLADMYASTDAVSGNVDIFYLAASLNGRVKFTGATIRGAYRDGIRCLGGRLMVTGCDVLNCGVGTTGDGIRLNDTTIKGFAINDNFFGAALDGSNNTRYGVYNGATAGNGKISDNQGTGMSGGIIGGTSSGTGISGNISY